MFRKLGFHNELHNGLLPFAGNYSPDRRCAASGWLSKCEQCREEESHVLSGKCTIYGEIRNRFSTWRIRNSDWIQDPGSWIVDS